MNQEKLRQELAAAKAEIDALVKVLGDKGDTIREKDKQLAERDLVIKQLKCFIDNLPIPEGVSVSEFYQALALQPTTEALDEFVQRAVEQEKERIAALCDEFHVKSEYPGFAEFAAAIREMKL